MVIQFKSSGLVHVGASVKRWHPTTLNNSSLINARTCQTHMFE